MRTYLFMRRNIKEILRDPLNLFFGLGFPLVLLGLLSLINANIPPEANNPMFEIKNLAPGLAMFGTVFFALFVGVLLAKDRTSSFLMRLFTSPMRASEFLLGYTLPMVIMASVQVTITLLASLFFGLSINLNLILAIFVSAITSLLFIGLGLLSGTLMNDKAVGGICGALLTNVAGWLSGVFIPLELIGGTFQKVTQVLPFYHNVEAIKRAMNGNLSEMAFHLGIVLAYTAVVFGIAILMFRKRMNGDGL